MTIACEISASPFHVRSGAGGYLRSGEEFMKEIPVWVRGLHAGFCNVSYVNWVWDSPTTTTKSHRNFPKPELVVAGIAILKTDVEETGGGTSFGRSQGSPRLRASIQSSISFELTMGVCFRTFSRTDPTRTTSSKSMRRASSGVSGCGFSHNSCRAVGIH